MAEITPPRRDESLIDVEGRPTLRFIEYLELLSSTVSIITNETVNVISTAPEVSSQSSLISRLDERLNDLESINDGDINNVRITALSAKVNRLIDELTDFIKGDLSTAINLIASIDSKLLREQGATTSELELLNARFEEAFDTGLDGRDA